MTLSEDSEPQNPQFILCCLCQMARKVVWDLSRAKPYAPKSLGETVNCHPYRGAVWNNSFCQKARIHHKFHATDKPYLSFGVQKNNMWVCPTLHTIDYTIPYYVLFPTILDYIEVCYAKLVYLLLNSVKWHHMTWN